MRVRVASAAVALTLCLGTVSGCVGRKANNDGDRVPGEPNPAQPYKTER